MVLCLFLFQSNILNFRLFKVTENVSQIFDLKMGVNIDVKLRERSLRNNEASERSV